MQTYVLAKHVEAKVLQHLEVIFHGFTVGWRVKTIWPISLVKSAKLEDELAIE
jgi:hypothetical protein